MKRLLGALRRETLKSELAPFEAVLVGRPNCGKSAIWNRLVKKNEAIVSPIAGTTRDRREGKAILGELEFTVVDTGGLEDSTGEISKAAQTQTQYAIEEADAIIFCVDAQVGITRDDEHFARYIRKLLSKNHTPILLANKTEGKITTFDTWNYFLQDCRRLGFGDPVPFSAAHGEGLSDLHDALLPAARKAKKKLIQDIEDTENQSGVDVESSSIPDEQKNPLEIKLTILGRPNSGKSTLVNTIIGSERVIAGPTPGLTRDAIAVNWIYENRPIKLVDTAGWRSKQKSALYEATKLKHLELENNPSKREKRDLALLEGLSVQRAFKALAETHVAALVVDIAATGSGSDNPSQTVCISHQDLTIAGKILEEGKPLIIVVNKVDKVLVSEPVKKPRRKLKLKKEVESGDDQDTFTRPLEEPDLNKLQDWVSEQFSQSIPQIARSPVILMSALKPNKEMVDNFMQAVIKVERCWSSRISTPKLNRWLREIVAKNPPPTSTVTFSKRNKKHNPKVKNMVPIPVKLKYITQVSSRPPTFAVFVNRHRPENCLDEAYQRYLSNQLQQHFDLSGVPIRFLIRSSGNPFVDGRKKSGNSNLKDKELASDSDDDLNIEEDNDTFVHQKPQIHSVIKPKQLKSEKPVTEFEFAEFSRKTIPRPSFDEKGL